MLLDMSPREYRLGRRGEAAEETRRRIVQATYDLHQEQGIAATTMKQIAARADVAIGTVYHHFPTYDDAITACGALSMDRHPLPDPATIVAAGSLERRVRALVDGMAAWYAAWPGFARVRRERAVSPALDAGMAMFDSMLAELVETVLGDAADDRTVAVCAVLLDPCVVERLPTDEVGDLLWAWLRSRRRNSTSSTNTSSTN